MPTKDSVYNEGFAYPFFKSFFTSCLRPKMIKALWTIFYYFFYAQHKAGFLPGRIPVKNVDHPLDEKIPFKPGWGPVYLDFVFFWTRVISFYLKRYGRKGFNQVGSFITSISNLYKYAYEVYKKIMSTTKRPFYIARPRFFLIHLVDPHLMCVPSLHVMIVIHGYTMFEQIAKQFNDEQNLKEDIKLMRQGALAITQAVLFVKQHSVNCIPAALYAMTRYAPDLFGEQEAVKFAKELFTDICVHPLVPLKTELPEKDKTEIREYIIMMYKKFLKEGKTAKSWEEPLIKFLQSM